MKILFFYVHPAKFHLFKNTIELLKQNGYHVDIVISDKDVLSDLLKNSNIEFTNIFPRGRKYHFLPNKVNAFFGLFLTLYKLWVYTRSKKYDVYVTDDVLTILGKIQGVPSIAFTDNDLVTIPLIKMIFKFSTKIVAPEATSLDELEHKKISFKGNKAIAHLGEKYFTAEPQYLDKYDLSGKKIIIIRLALLTANHDTHGNLGITNKDLDTLFELIPPTFTPIISSERKLPEKYKVYQYLIQPEDFTQLLAQSSFFIGDSGTMATEAAVLGIPNILINNIAKKCGVHVELQSKFELQYYFDTFEEAISTIKSLFLNENTQECFKRKRVKFLEESDDFNLVLYNAIIEYEKK